MLPFGYQEKGYVFMYMIMLYIHTILVGKVCERSFLPDLARCNRILTKMVIIFLSFNASCESP